MAGKTIWKLPVVMGKTGKSRSSIYSGVAEGTFPPQINIGPRAVGWIADAVESWIQDRIDDSRKDDLE